MPKPKIPKDLGIKIGTPDEVLWTNVLNNAKNEIKAAENAIKVATEVVKIAKSKIKIEKKAMSMVS